MRILLDTNVWRHLVDADAVERLRSLSRSSSVEIVVAPAVVYEMLRTPDPALRTRLLKAVTLGAWARLRTEVFYDCEDVRAVIARRRPDWLSSDRDLRGYYALRADWSPRSGDFWRRARREPAAEARRLATLEGNLLELARAEARERRVGMGHIQYDDVRLHGWVGRPRGRVPGFDGDDIEVWRLLSAGSWWHALIDEPRDPYLDWIGPFLDRKKISQSLESWNRLWFYEVGVGEVPREWLRWAVGLLQSVRKVTPGTPADNQIAVYALQADVFVSADKAIVDILNRVRQSAPAPIATGHSMAPGDDPVAQIAALALR